MARNHRIFLRFMLAAFTAGVLLAGCQHRPVHVRLGKPALPPTGWYGYCARHSEDPDCNKETAHE